VLLRPEADIWAAQSTSEMPEINMQDIAAAIPGALPAVPTLKFNLDPKKKLASVEEVKSKKKQRLNKVKAQGQRKTTTPALTAADRAKIQKHTQKELNMQHAYKRIMEKRHKELLDEEEAAIAESREELLDEEEAAIAESREAAEGLGQQIHELDIDLKVLDDEYAAAYVRFSAIDIVANPQEHAQARLDTWHIHKKCEGLRRKRSELVEQMRDFGVDVEAYEEASNAPKASGSGSA
jgi:hypothetical protein